MKPLSKASQQGLHGTLAVPGDKSISHRALMIGSISQGATHIHHFLAGQDCLSTLKAFQDLGVEIERQQDEVIVHGKGMMHLRPASIPLDMGNSGTTTRLMMGLLAGTSFTSTLIGDQSLSKRPMKRVSEPLSELGVQVKLTEKGTLPAQVVGGTVHGKTVKLQVASAQVKSALILAALAADQPTTIIEKLPTRNHTEIMLRQFGAEIETATNQRTITVQPHPDLVGQDVQVPGDMSSAAFFMVAATIIPNSEITLKNVSLNPTRTGILRTMLKMGLIFEWLNTKRQVNHLEIYM